MRIKYVRLLKEILFNSDTGRDLIDFGGLSENDLIDMLTGEKIITVIEAQKIKKLIGSKLPLEELFAEG